MKKITILFIIIIAIIVIILFTYTQIFRKINPAIGNTVNLKMNQEKTIAIPGADFKLRVKLIKIGKMSELYDLPEEKSINLLENNAYLAVCNKEDTNCINNLNYYILQVENLDFNGCSQHEVIVSSYLYENYDCNGFTKFIVSPKKSDGQQIEFTVDHLNIKFE
jgi:hypothetical protein